MGQAIRPRQKLGSGIQGQVRVLPSAVKGKRAHPHLAEKRLIEGMNRKEYQKALASAISATASVAHLSHPHRHLAMPIIVGNEVESVSKTKEMLKFFNNLKITAKATDRKAHIKKGLRRSTRQKRYKKSVLLVVGKESAAIMAARNIAGVDACAVSGMTANLLAPGGRPGRLTVWSEQAIKNLDASVKELKLS
jgi:large subunit ribosomal protein L4e